jgi:D-alanyl-D-alanine carboxypeptidase (penicillin-binding protein 5/6)
MKFKSFAVIFAWVFGLVAFARAADAPPALPNPVPVETVSELSAIPVPALSAKAWISIDVVTGQVIATSNPDQKIEPASLTKIMTAYVVFNALKEKRLTLEQDVPVSQLAWKTGGSRMFIEPRKPVNVDELLKGLIIQSGNDAAVALAEATSGNVSTFAETMNKEAKRLGMKNSNFTNPDGLPDPTHVTTVRDLALLARALIIDHPDYFKYYSMKEFVYNKIKQSNRNRLLWTDPTVDGMKTGFTNAAGYCLVATALRGDRRVLTVLVGADTRTARTEESLKLLNWSFQNFETVKLFDKTHPAAEARVWKGVAESVKLGSLLPVVVTVPKGKATEVKPVTTYLEPLIAPLEEGQDVGTLTLLLDNKVLRTQPLVALDTVSRAGFFGRLSDTVRLWFR